MTSGEHWREAWRMAETVRELEGNWLDGLEETPANPTPKQTWQHDNCQNFEIPKSPA